MKPDSPTTRRHVLAALAGTSLFASAGCSAFSGSATTTTRSFTATASWSQFGADAHNSGVAPNGGPADDPDERWSRTVGAKSNAAPIVHDGTVYTLAKTEERGVGALRAIDEADGTVEWQRDVDAIVSSTPAVTTDKLVVPTIGDHAVHGYDRRSGDREWRVEVRSSSNASAPAVHDDHVYLGVTTGDAPDQSGRLLAVDASDGRVAWTHDTPGEVESSPAVTEEKVYVGTKATAETDGLLYALDRETGDVVWKQSTDAHFGTATATDSTVFVGSSGAAGGGSTFMALDAATGEVVWDADLAGWSLQAPAVDTDLVVAIGWNGEVKAFDRRGTVQWRFETPAISRTAPALTSERVYFGASDGVHALDRATGDERWFRDGDANTIESSPAVANGTLYVGDDLGTLHALW